MRNKGLIITTIVFFLLVITTYYWDRKLGFFALLAFLILVVVFIGLGIELLRQLHLAFKEKFKDKQRLLTIGLLTIVLCFTFLKQFGLINFDIFEGKDILIAQSEGAANCTTTFKLKENNRFIERSICFGVTEIKGTYKLKNDTIFFENVVGRSGNEYYKFALIRHSDSNLDSEHLELVRYEALNDTIGNGLWITENDLDKQTDKKPNR